jgi:hypothetical protein
MTWKEVHVYLVGCRDELGDVAPLAVTPLP